MVEMDNILICGECQKVFSNKSNLRLHVRRFHKDKLNLLAPLCKRDSTNFKFSCPICKRKFNHEENYRCHMNEHKATPQKRIIVSKKKCPLCDYTSKKQEDMLDHFKTAHHIPIEIEEIKFRSLTKFTEWKHQMENRTHSKFIKYTGQVGSKVRRTRLRYICRRSGNYNSKGGKLDRVKSCKINGFCPAGIKIISERNGGYKVQFISCHIGHEHNIDYLNLTLSDKRYLAKNFASKTPFDTILDEIASEIPYSDQIKPIHTLTRNDLINISRYSNLPLVEHQFDEPIGKDPNWITEINKDGNSVLFYKAQGTSSTEYSYLRKDDFILVIMTATQLEHLKRFGSNCVCVDNIQTDIDDNNDANNDLFELTTLLVIDDLREGFPCAILVSNRVDTLILKLFFQRVKTRAGEIKAKIFMSGLAYNFYSPWVDEMGWSEKRLFSTWHIIDAWTKNSVAKIKSEEKQKQTLQKLKALLQEKNASTFQTMLSNFCTNRDPDLANIINYFKKFYFMNREYWAFSYRQNSIINGNSHLEHTHDMIKSLFLNSKNGKSVDKSVAAVMKFTKYKLIAKLRDKIPSKLKDIPHRHENIKSLNTNLVKVTNNGWEVASHNSIEIYHIESLNPKCNNCRLVCVPCGICIHQYLCTCMDSSIKFNICKHIHLLCKWKQEQLKTVTIESKDSPRDITKALQKDILHKVDVANQNKTLEEEKDDLINYLKKQIDKIDNHQQFIELSNKLLAPFAPTVHIVIKKNSTKPVPLPPLVSFKKD